MKTIKYTNLFVAGSEHQFNLAANKALKKGYNIKIVKIIHEPRYPVFIYYLLSKNLEFQTRNNAGNENF